MGLKINHRRADEDPERGTTSMQFIGKLSDRQRKILRRSKLRAHPGLADPTWQAEQKIDWQAIDALRDPEDDSKQQR